MIRAINLRTQWGWLRWVLLLLAISHQIFFLVHTSRLGWDELVQLAQARNFLAGENFALATTSPANLAAVDYTVDVHFPVGYAALMALGLEFFPNPVVVDFLWQAVAAMMFFGGWFAVLELCGAYLGVGVRLAIWLYWALVIPPLWATVYTDHATIYLPLGLMAVALALILWAVRSESGFWPKVALSGAVIGLAAPLHYTYWPLLGVIPGTLILYGWLYGARWHWVQAGLLNGAVAGMFLLVLVAYNLTNTGQIFDAHFAFSGPHPEHLLRIAPFPLAVFGFSAPVFRLPHSPPESNIHPPLLPGSGLEWVVSGVILLLVAWAAYRALRQAQADRAGIRLLYLAGLLTTAGMTVFLGYRSVYMALDGYAGGWVFAQELRYFAPAVPFLAVGLADALRHPPAIPGRRVLQAGLLAGVIVCAVYLGGWRADLTLRQATGTDGTPTLGRAYYDDHPIIAPIRNARDAIDPDLPAVMLAPTDAVIRVHAQAAGLPLAEVGTLPAELMLGASEPRLVLVATYAFDVEGVRRLETLAERYGGQLFGFEPYRVFAFRLMPGE